MKRQRTWLSGLLAAVVAAVLALGVAPASALAETHQFSDVTDSNWYAEASDWAYDNFMMSGYGDGQFHGGDTLSRAQMAALLYNTLGDDGTYAAAPQTDVDQAAWYAPAVNWAVAKGIMGNGSAESFRPNDTITREEAVTVVANAASTLKGVDTTDTNEAAFNALPDSKDGDYDSWAKNDLVWAVDKGIIGNGHYVGARDNIDRAQAATIMMNAITNGSLPVADVHVTASVVDTTKALGTETWIPETSYEFRSENVKALSVFDRLINSTPNMSYAGVNESWGYFLSSVTKDGTTLDTPADYSHYWNFLENGEYAQLGVGAFVVKDNDNIVLSYA